MKDRRSYPGPGEVPSRAAAAWPRARARSGELEPASAWAIDRHHSSGAPVIRWGRPRACVFSGIWQYRDTTEALLFTTGFFFLCGGERKTTTGRRAFFRPEKRRLSAVRLLSSGPPWGSSAFFFFFYFAPRMGGSDAAGLLVSDGIRQSQMIHDSCACALG